MGWGDELIAAGQARAMRAHDPRKVRILDRNKARRQHEAWENSPSVALPYEIGDFQHLVNGVGARPYIAHESSHRFTWKPFRCTPAELRFNREEQAWAEMNKVPGAVVVQPLLKPKATRNKDWGWDKWEAFARMAVSAGHDLVQLSPSGQNILPGARWIQTPTMRFACAVLSTARAYVGHEGGLHHAAAALGKPGVVIFGGFISPAQTGYDLHRNLFTGGEPCGERQPCQHCRKAMARIEPAQVLAELEGID